MPRTQLDLLFQRPRLFSLLIGCTAAGWFWLSRFTAHSALGPPTGGSCGPLGAGLVGGAIAGLTGAVTHALLARLRDREDALHRQEEAQQRAARRIRETEARLAGATTRFDAMFRQAGTAFGTLDATGHLIRRNPALERILSEAGNGETDPTACFASLLAPGDGARFDELRTAALAGRPRSAPLLCRMLRCGEDPLHMEVRLHPLPASDVDGACDEQSGERAEASADDKGGGERLLLSLTDITERRRAEAALQESEERLRLVFRTASVGIGVGTLDGRLFEVNPMLCELLGRSADDLKRVHFTEYTHPSDLHAEFLLLQELRAGARDSYTIQKRCRRGDGRDVWVRLGVSVAHDGNGRTRFAVCVYEDVTDRVRAAEEARVIEEQFRHAQRLEGVGRMAAGVAHDFNNRLSVMLCAAGMIRKRHGDVEATRNAVDTIERAANQSARLTGQLLAFSRKAVEEHTFLDIHAVIREVTALLEHTIDKRIAVRTLLSARRSLVRGDPTQVQNMLFNLAVNACDAMPDGGCLTFRTELVDAAGAALSRAEAERREDARLEVTVADTGVGVEPDVLPHIFQPFFTTKETGKGTGLGLAAVRNTVTSLGGEIDVESTPGAGCVFRINLPPAVPESKQEPASEEASPAACPTGRILVVDDEEDVAATGAEILRANDHEVDVAGGASEALRFVRDAERPYDLILLDVMMPEVSGLDLFASLRLITPQTRVLLSSGHSMPGDVEAALADGAVGYLPKPYDVPHLIREVARALQQPPPDPAVGIHAEAESTGPACDGGRTTGKATPAHERAYSLPDQGFQKIRAG